MRGDTSPCEVVLFLADLILTYVLIGAVRAAGGKTPLHTPAPLERATPNGAGCCSFASSKIRSEIGVKR